MAFEPGTVRQPLVRHAESREALVESRGVIEVDVPRGHRRLRQMQMGIGQARDRDLIRLEPDPLRERVGARLQIDLGTGECDPPVADADRLDPAEALIARERGDTARDERVQRHGRSAYRLSHEPREAVTIEARRQPERERDPRLDRAERSRRDRPSAHPRRAAAGERVGRRSRRRPDIGMPGPRRSRSRMARSAAASISGDVFPAPVAATTTPRAPASTAASIITPSVPMPASTSSTRAPSDGAGRRRRRGPRPPAWTSPASPIVPSDPRFGERNVSNAVVCILVTSSAASIVPASATTTPASRSVGEAAAATARRRFAGPS